MSTKKGEQPVAVKEKEPEAVQSNEPELDPDKFIMASYYGTFDVPHPEQSDKRKEQKFSVDVPVPREILETDMNWHSHFKYTQAEVFKEHFPDFKRFRKVYFLEAKNLDGSEINDPKTFSPDRLKRLCLERGFKVDFNMYHGIELRNVIFQFFLRKDKVDESDTFYKKQERERKVRGMKNDLRAAQATVPKAQRIVFKEV